MTKPVIAVDVDDVCADLIGEWVNRYNVEFGDSKTRDDVRGWEITRYLPRATKDEVFELLDDPELYDGIQPMPGALDTIGQLRYFGRVVFLTACHAGKGADAKCQWLFKHGFIKDVRDFIAAKDKSLIRASYLFDDCVENVERFPGCGVLVNHTHNASSQTKRPRLDFSRAPQFIAEFFPLRNNTRP